MNKTKGSSYSSFTCKYGRFTIYCLVDTEEYIVHLTFTLKKHKRAIKRLADSEPASVVNPGQQDQFIYNSLFEEYFNGNLTNFPLKFKSHFIDSGTDFQKKVWQRLAEIPFGMTRTYGEIAELAGSPKSARAVGMACGANPLALIIPCHRVVAAHGLGGFAGGVETKKGLLELEQRNLE
jgi:methylated-DNA-[protein]-cysteine S-methyltransferase